MQKQLIGFESKKAAQAEEKKLYSEATAALLKKATQGLTWDQVVGRWEMAKRNDSIYEGQHQYTTIIDQAARLHKWTELWLKRPAATLNRGDARQAIQLMMEAGKSRGFQHQLKHTVNVIYEWGIEQRLIRGVQQSPMRGLQIGGLKQERVPDILTLEEIKKLLHEAKILDHAWYPTWAMALLTGMRNGELHALLWSDVDAENRRITVSKSFRSRRKVVKSTKSGQWRTVPISDELLGLLTELKASAGHRANVLPPALEVGWRSTDRGLAGFLPGDWDQAGQISCAEGVFCDSATGA